MGDDKSMWRGQGTQHSMKEDPSMYHFPLHCLMLGLIFWAKVHFGSSLVKTKFKVLQDTMYIASE